MATLITNSIKKAAAEQAAEVSAVYMVISSGYSLSEVIEAIWFKSFIKEGRGKRSPEEHKY